MATAQLDSPRPCCSSQRSFYSTVYLNPALSNSQRSRETLDRRRNS